MKLEIPEFEEKSELFSWLVANKTTLINQKKFEIKHGDAITYCSKSLEREETEEAEKGERNLLLDADKIKVKSIINTTGLMDSHSDVHINGLWKKSLSENNNIYLLKEHRMTFENIISDDVKAYTKNMTWQELGAPYEGTTQALVFDSKIEKGRNPYMYDQYVKGYVKNHSVGMRYYKLYLAINDKSYTAEFEAWNKYFSHAVNKEAIEEQGYFWAVTEAGIIEGSAVVKGSNWVTPTESVTATKEEEPQPEVEKEEEKEEIIVTKEIVNFININLY